MTLFRPLRFPRWSILPALLACTPAAALADAPAPPESPPVSLADATKGLKGKGTARRTGHDTTASQSFITEVATPWLKGRHPIFGACEPLDLESKLARLPSSPGANRPNVDVVIKKVPIARVAAKK